MEDKEEMEKRRGKERGNKGREIEIGSGRRVEETKNNGNFCYAHREY